MKISKEFWPSSLPVYKKKRQPIKHVTGSRVAKLDTHIKNLYKYKIWDEEELENFFVRRVKRDKFKFLIYEKPLHIEKNDLEAIERRFVHRFFINEEYLMEVKSNDIHSVDLNKNNMAINYSILMNDRDDIWKCIVIGTYKIQDKFFSYRDYEIEKSRKVSIRKNTNMGSVWYGRE